jgi:hypothetical protein
VPNNGVRYIAPKISVGQESRQGAENDKKGKQGQDKEIRHLRREADAIFPDALEPDLAERRWHPKSMRPCAYSVRRVSRMRDIVNRHL